MTRPTGEPGPPTGVSRTAVVITQAREAESARPDRLFDDPLAGPLADAAGRITGISEAGRQAAEHFVLRTRFFDDRLREAAGRACGRWSCSPPAWTPAPSGCAGPRAPACSRSTCRT